jgi:hypothetical protein
MIRWGSNYEDEARDIAVSIHNTQTRLRPVLRVTIREGGETLQHILNVTDTKEGRQLRKNFNIPPVKERKRMKLAENLLFDAYQFFYDQIKDLGPDKAWDLYQNFKNRVYLMVSISPSAKTARKFVLGLGKGKNMELVDEFKALVCFDCVSDVKEQDKLLDRWNELESEVGREVLQQTCLFWAQITLRRPCKKFCEVDLMMECLRKYGRRASVEGQAQDGGGSVQYGSAFFDHRIKPAAKLLHEYRRDGSMFQWALSETASVESYLPCLTFLRNAAQIATSKELELAILGLLYRWEKVTSSEQRIARERDLIKLEQIALWMMLCKPKKAVREQRCIAIARRGTTPHESSYDVSDDPLLLSSSERKTLKDALHLTAFHRTSLPKAAKIILERLNGYELLESSQVGRLTPLSQTLELEHVLPQKYKKHSEWTQLWNDDDAEEWLHRLGNLALLNKRTNTKISNGPFLPLKRNDLGRSPYPLTRKVAEYADWNVASVEKNHKDLLGIAHKVWELQ